MEIITKKQKFRKIIIFLLCITALTMSVITASAESYSVPGQIEYSVTSFMGNMVNRVFNRNLIEYVTIDGAYVNEEESIAVHSDKSQIENIYFFAYNPGTTINIDDAVKAQQGKVYYCVVELSDGHLSAVKKVVMHTHNYELDTIITKATCDTDGTAKGVCSCGDITTLSIPATGHQYTTEIVKKASCTETGIKRHTCVKCGYVYDDVAPTEDHVPGERVKENVIEGISYDYAYHCKNCGQLLSSTTRTTLAYENKNVTDENGSVDMRDKTESDIVKGVLITAYNGASSTVTIPSEINMVPVMLIGEKVFYYYNGYRKNAAGNTPCITDVTIPDTVVRIRASAFEGCSKLTNISLGNGLRVIEEYAFRGCTSLKTITIPASVVEIDGTAFYECNSLENIYVDENNPNYCSVDGVLYSKDMSEIVWYPHAKPISSYTVPEGVTAIGTRAFQSLKVTDIAFPASVTRIGDYAFANCYNLTEVKFAEDSRLLEIGDGAFYRDENLANVEIPDSVVTIKDAAFQECTNFTNIVIPDNVTKIGNYAFAYCNNVKSIKLGNSVKRIGFSAFSGCNITDISIPDSVTFLSTDAFACSRLTRVNLGSGVRYISANPFGKYAKVTDIYYNGNEEQKTSIKIEDDNSILLNAVWHYTE